MQRSKMIGFVIVILFALSFPCEGKIILPPEGNTFFVLSGADVKIAWTFDNEISTLVTRQWFFDVDGRGLLAQIILDGDVNIQSPGQLLRINVTRNGTLILKNVDQQHNGKYRFEITLAGNVKQSSVVTVFAENSSLIINCTSPSTLIISEDVTGTLTVDKNDDVRCLCKDETGNPPTNVTWYKNGVQHGVPRIKENILSLSNVVRGDSGTYKCETQSYILNDEKSVKLTVEFAPEKISLTTSPEKAELNKSLIITCNADGHPEPTYKIIYNNSNTVSTNKTYTIAVVKYTDAGSYRCIATNKLDSEEKTIKLTFPSKEITTKATSKPASKSSKPSETDSGQDESSDDGLSGGAIAGIIIGVLVLLLIIVFVVWKCKYSKEKESSGFSDNGVDPSNQDNVQPIANESAYESLGDGKKPENLYDEARLGNDNGGAGSTSDTLPPVYATVDKDKKKNKKKNEPAPANTPPVYPTVDKTRHNEPSVNYATLDTVAMQPTGSSKRDRRDQPTEYASIAEFGVKGDLV